MIVCDGGSVVACGGGVTTSLCQSKVLFPSLNPQDYMSIDIGRGVVVVSVASLSSKVGKVAVEVVLVGLGSMV